jgi:IMP dehydrogenase
MKKTVKAYVLKFPENTSYRAIAKRPFEELPIKDVSIIDDIILKTWQRILGIMKHYEAIYHVPFNLKKEQVRLEDLVPTQPQVIKAQIDSIREPLVPIACIEHQGKYYILDGHARSLRAKQLGLDSTEAMVLLPPVKMDFGIIKTAKETNLRTLEDIRILG